MRAGAEGVGLNRRLACGSPAQEPSRIRTSSVPCCVVCLGDFATTRVSRAPNIY